MKIKYYLCIRIKKQTKIYKIMTQNFETVVYVLKDGAPSHCEEFFASFKGKVQINTEKVNEIAAKRGYHFHRVAYINLGISPDFTKVF